MFDLILAKFWVPKGTPLYRHHLPTIFIGFALTLILMSLALISELKAFAVMIVLIGLQFFFTWCAQKRFGDTKPKNSI